MARNRSNRGSGSARRGRDDAPQRGDFGSAPKPEGDQPAVPASVQPSTVGPGSTAPVSARPGAGPPGPSTAGTPPPAASPSGASTTSPTSSGPTPASPSPAAPFATRPAAPSTAGPAPAAGRPAEPRALNAHAAGPAGSGAPGGAAARPTSTSAGSPSGGQRPQGGGPDRPGSGARPPASGGAGRNFGVGLLGGVIGGAAVALLVLWYQSGGDELAALRGRIAQVESTVASAAGGGDQVQSLTERIQALEGASGGDLASRLEALEARVEGQSTTQAQLEGAEGGTGPDLSGRIAEIEAALAQLPAGDDSELAQLEQRLAALEDAGSATAAPDEGAAALQEAVSTLQARLATLAARLPEDTQSRLSQIDQRLGAAEQAESRLQQLSGTLEQLRQEIATDEQQSQEITTQLSALGERLSGAESRLEAALRDRNRASALALIVGQLEAAIDEARPYQTQMQALTAMTEGGAGASDAMGEAISQAVSALEPGAAGGMPTLAELRRSFEPVANEIVHAARAPDGNNLIDRATENLMRLVTVRPVGDDVRGDSAEARVARAEAALDGGDLAGAVAELEQLQGRPAEAAADWLSRAEVRLGADQAVATLRTQATQLLSQGN